MKEKLQIALVLSVAAAVRFVALWFPIITSYGPVDVYSVDQAAARLVLGLQNPYRYDYIVHGVGGNIFTYLPMVPVYYAPFLFLGEIRIGSIVADLVIVASLYYLVKTIKPDGAIYAALSYALLPISIWLTSVSATNMMVGTMFLIVSLAALQNGRYSLSAAMLGLGLATNQLVFLALPVYLYHYWRQKKISILSLAALISLAIILPFYVGNPQGFYYGVVVYHFSRPFQIDGQYSLYALVYASFGLRLNVWIRSIIFLSSSGLLMLWYLRTKSHFLLPIAGMLLLGVFVLPVDGFWNYFLAPGAVCCALLPCLANPNLLSPDWNRFRMSLLKGVRLFKPAFSQEDDPSDTKL